jgi:PilZ domain
MTIRPTQVERRAAQRFDYQLPLAIRRADGGKEEFGFTQNLSARGIFFYTDCPLQPGAKVDITLMMPAEITLSENMRVRCQGKVLRANPQASGCKTGVAVLFEHYEYLPDAVPSLSAASSKVTGQPALTRQPTLITP